MSVVVLYLRYKSLHTFQKANLRESERNTTGGVLARLQRHFTLATTPRPYVKKVLHDRK